MTTKNIKSLNEVFTEYCFAIYEESQKRNYYKFSPYDLDRIDNKFWDRFNTINSTSIYWRDITHDLTINTPLFTVRINNKLPENTGWDTEMFYIKLNK